LTIPLNRECGQGDETTKSEERKMSIFHTDWLAQQLHEMRHEDLVRAATQERLSREARQQTGKQGDDATPLMKTIARGMNWWQQKKLPEATVSGECCATGRAATV